MDHVFQTIDSMQMSTKAALGASNGPTLSNSQERKWESIFSMREKTTIRFFAQGDRLQFNVHALRGPGLGPSICPALEACIMLRECFIIEETCAQRKMVYFSKAFELLPGQPFELLKGMTMIWRNRALFRVKQCFI